VISAPSVPGSRPDWVAVLIPDFLFAGVPRPSGVRGSDFSHFSFALPPVEPLTPPPQPSNPQSSPFPAKRLAPRPSHAILSRVSRATSPSPASHRPVSISFCCAQPLNLHAFRHATILLPTRRNLCTFARSLCEESPHPRPLLSCQHFTPVSPLAATLMDLPASVANKRLAARLTPLDATLTKNREVGARCSNRYSHLLAFALTCSEAARGVRTRPG
jgi:hypothetical protein